MKPLAFVLIAIVASMVLTGIPVSYADPQLDTLLRIATQARDNLNIQLSQISPISNDINQLYVQGSSETDALAQSVANGDVSSARQHFLSAMKIFKMVNDKISSLTQATINEQTSQVDMTQLRGEITRMQNLGDRLKSIATRNNVEIDFTKFDQLMQDAKQNLDAGNINDVNKTLEAVNLFLLDAHHILAEAANKKTSDRAKDFTEKQIERLGKLSQAKAAQTLNATQSIVPSAAPVQQTNASKIKSSEDVIAKLRQLVAEGKINEALKLIKSIEALQREKLGSNVTNEAANSTQVVNETSNVSPQMIAPANSTQNGNETNMTKQANSTGIKNLPNNIGNQSQVTNATGKVTQNEQNSGNHGKKDSKVETQGQNQDKKETSDKKHDKKDSDKTSDKNVNIG